MPSTAAASTARPGRRPVTSRAELESVSLDLFVRHGFEAVSVEDIAETAGIGRRTFFRYFPSKNDAVWGDFDAQLSEWRAWFDACPDEVPLLAAVRRAVVAFNSYDEAALVVHRQRMRIILGTPTLQAHSTLRYGAWREVVSEFVARRLGERVTDLRPRVVGQVALACALAAYEQWLHDDTDPTIDRTRPLADYIEEALFVLGDDILDTPRTVGGSR